MSKIMDKTGKRYGRLTVLHRVENAEDGAIQWLCQCDCGKTKVFRSSNLKENGSTYSCGCYKRECLKNQKNGYKHGMNGTRIYRIWNGIKWRCFNKNNTSYKYYGGRGITICDEWLNSFESFYKWSLENGYRDDLVIDRIDNNGNYEPDNCRWTTVIVNDNNKRNNRYIEYNGETHTAAEWSRIIGAKDRHAVSDRIQSGWSIEDAVTTPSGANKYFYIEICGVKKTLSQWSKEYGIGATVIQKRISSGWDHEKAVTTPVIDPRKYIEINGKKKSISDWSKEYGISRATIYLRIKNGWNPVTAVTTPLNNKRGGD